MKMVMTKIQFAENYLHILIADFTIKDTVCSSPKALEKFPVNISGLYMLYLFMCKVIIVNWTATNQPYIIIIFM